MHRWDAPTHQRTCIMIAVGSSRAIWSTSQWCFWKLLYILRIFQYNIILNLHITAYISTWIQSIIGQWLENIPYGMPPKQPYTFGQLISKHTYYVVPLSKYTMHSSTPLPHTCYASSLMKYYLVTLWPPWMLHSKVNLPLKTKAMTVAAKILTYPHQLDEPPRFTTSPVKNMHPLIQTQSCHAAEVLENHPADWYADASLSVLPRRIMMTPQWMRPYLHLVHCQCSITQIPSSNHLPTALSICMLP